MARMENWPELVEVENWLELAEVGQKWVWPHLLTRAWKDVWPKLTRVELRREMGGHWR